MTSPVRTSIAMGLAAALVGALPAPANAQSATLAPAAARSWSKSEAILGGQPSALQAILAQQSGLPAVARSPSPASYSARIVPAVIRDAPAVSPAVLSGRPDVFGSVALRVQRAPLLARWRKVEQAGLTGSAAGYARSLNDLDQVARLETVNRYVNDRVQFVDDRKQHGRADVWSAAAETLTRGRGDCEDYAIAKLQMLRRAGFADRDLYLVIVKDLVSRSDHAVLVVRAAGEMYVLDNGTNRLLTSEAIRDYRPILTFAASGTWTHGYRVRPAPMTIASADMPDASSLAENAVDQRSRSASLLAFNTGFSR